MMNLYLKAAGLGVIAGMRSMSAPALASSYFAAHPSPTLAVSPLKGLGLPRTALILKLMALGELGADKLPGIPNRTAPGPLGGRAVSGAICGAAVFLAEGKPAGIGAAVGAAAAVASSFAFFHLRQSLGKSIRFPDPALAAVEDALVLGLGKAVFAAA